MDGSNLDNISLSEADFLTLASDVINTLLENVHKLSLDMSVVIGAGTVLIGGLLMLLFASHSSGGQEDTVSDYNNDASDKAAKKVEKEEKERQEQEQQKEKEERELREIQERERQEKERSDREKQEKQEKEKQEKLDWKRKEEQEKKEKEEKEKSESDREKEGLSKTGEASLMGRKNTTERLAEANAIFQRIIESLNFGKKEADIAHLFNELAETGKSNEFSGVIESTKLYLQEHGAKERQSLSLKKMSNWFEKEADIVEGTASRMKEGPKKEELLEKAANFYINAAEFQVLQNSTKAITNFEKAENLASFNNEKLARYGEACLIFERSEKAQEIGDVLVNNMAEDLNRKNVSSCLIFCDKMYDANLEEPAVKMKKQIKEVLKEKGILIPANGRGNHKRLMEMIKEHQQEKEEKEA